MIKFKKEYANQVLHLPGKIRIDADNIGEFEDLVREKFPHLIEGGEQKTAAKKATKNPSSSPESNE